MFFTDPHGNFLERGGDGTLSVNGYANFQSQIPVRVSLFRLRAPLRCRSDQWRLRHVELPRRAE